MRTTTDRWFLRLITRTTEPNGRVGWQAVIAFISKRSPLAVGLPLNTSPYQEATPWLVAEGCLPSGFLGASKAGVALWTGSAKVAVATGWERCASACTIRVESEITSAVSATEEAQASSHIRSGGVGLVLLDFCFLTICQFY